MKKFIAAALVIAFAAAFTPSFAYAAEGSGMEDTVIDKATDWFAVLGKPEDEKDAILAERRADRAAERFAEAMRKAGKKAEKKMAKFGKDMGKLFE